jgi:hypothetical protein
VHHLTRRNGIGIADGNPRLQCIRAVSLSTSKYSVNDPAGIFGATAQANTTVQLSATACAGRPGTPGAAGPWNATVLSKNANAVGFTVPSGPTAGTNGAVKPYNVCVYDSSITTTSVNNLQGGSVVYVGAPLALNASGGSQLMLTTSPATPLFTGGTVGALFSTAPCAGNYGTPPANLVATYVKWHSSTAVSVSVPSGVGATTGATMNYYVCLYDSAAPTGALLSFANYQANSISLTPAGGSSLVSNGVTATSPMPFLSGVTTPAVLALGPGAGCPATFSTAPIGTVTPIALTTAAVRRLSNNRAALTVPPLALQQPGQPTPYQLCFYSGNTANSSLLGAATYTAAVVASPAAITPAAGPTGGGNVITVSGTDFPTDPGRITATLGGAPLTNIQPLSDKAFTAVAPAHAAEDNVALVMSTSAGTKALAGAYSFLEPIKLSPNTAPSIAPTVDVDVQGSGFMGINFGTTGNAGRVFLVAGTYNGADAGGGVRANGPVADCGNVLVISDDELICTLQLNRRLNATGTGFFDSVAYTNNVTNDLSTVAGSRVISSAGAKFKANDQGQPIVQQGGGTEIPASIVTSVLSSSKVVISVPATATSTSPLSANIGGAAVHTFTSALTTTQGSPTVSVSSGAFTRADIGRVFSGTPGVPNGTTIVAVAPGGASATLSAPATASTQYSLAGATTTDNSTTIASSAIAAGDVGAVVGPNPLGIPVGTTISAVPNAGTSGTLSAPAVGGGTGQLGLNKPVTATLYASAAVPDGSYNLVVVSNGAPDAAATDPDYFQTAVTSSSAFTVGAF